MQGGVEGGKEAEDKEKVGEFRCASEGIKCNVVKLDDIPEY